MWSVLDSLWSNFRLVDLLDLAFVALILYLAIHWAIHSASRYLIGGFFVLFGIYLLAQALDLYLTAMIFSGLATILTFALIVIFQEEIRRFFERIARLGWISKKPLDDSRDFVDQIVEALLSLSSRRHGAILVICGDEPIERHLEGGVKLMGQLSHPLLMSLFDPGSPGHDGAVIIEGTQVQRFSTQLPLARQQESIRDLGTRHSAALGMSERSDALVLVVSEETGKISAAENGHLSLGLRPLDLRRRIESFFHGEAEGQGKMSLLSISPQRAVAMSLAVLLSLISWLVVVYQPGKALRTFDIPIEVRAPKGELFIEKVVPERMAVTLLGKGGTIHHLDASKIRLSISIPELKEGVHKIPVHAGMVQNPTGTSVYQVDPAYVHATVVSLEEADLPIQVVTTGRLAPGVSIARIRALPESIRVLVLGNRNAKGLKIKTLPIDLNGLDQSQSFDTSLDLPYYLRLQDPNQMRLNVSVEVATKGQPK